MDFFNKCDQNLHFPFSGYLYDSNQILKQGKESECAQRVTFIFFWVI